MKKFLLASVALAAIAGPAMAADMPIKAPPPPPVVYYDWTGAYIGFNAGSVWSHDRSNFPQSAADSAAPDREAGITSRPAPASGIFGFHAGAQWQWGAWVLGAEAALSGCFSECRARAGLFLLRGFPANTFFQHKITNLFTVGPRLGYAWDRWMIFATGGYASADLKTAACSQVTGLCNQGNLARFNGAVAQQWLVCRRRTSTTWSTRARWSTCMLGVEYQHYDVGSKNAFCFNPGLQSRDRMGRRPERQGRHRACTPDDQDFWLPLLLLKKALRASGPPRVLCSD